MLRRGHEPRARIAWNARFRPLLECCNQRVVREVFSQPDVTDDASQAGDEPGRLDSPDSVECTIRVAGTHAFVQGGSALDSCKKDHDAGRKNKELTPAPPRLWNAEHGTGRVFVARRGYMKRKGSAV